MNEELPLQVTSHNPMQSSNKSQVSVATSLDLGKRKVIQSYLIFDRNYAFVHSFVLEI